MAFQNTKQRPLSADETARLKTHLAVRADLYKGLTAAGIEAAINKPRAEPNPRPMVPIFKGQFTKAEVQRVLTPIILTLMGAASPLLPRYQFLLDQVNAHAEDVFLLSDVQAYLSQAEADGVLTAAQITSIAAIPDPNYQESVQAGAYALSLFDAPLYIEASDVSIFLS